MRDSIADVPEPDRGPSAADGLPGFLRGLGSEADDRPIPELGLGDHRAAAALLAATRALLMASSAEEVAFAVARFVTEVGGDVAVAHDQPGRVLPLDIAAGTGVVVLVHADPMSVARMRLEQFLPSLVEDARTVVARLAHLRDLELALRAGDDGMRAADERR